MGAMELRRLKLASKPAIVVPNHMLEQFSREFLQLPGKSPGHPARRPPGQQAPPVHRPLRDR